MTTDQLTPSQQALLEQATGTPSAEQQARSRQRVAGWLAETAPLIEWGTLDTPFGLFYLARSARGLCRLGFYASQDDFIARLDPLARTEYHPAALASAITQLGEYFAGTRRQFDLDLDLSSMSPFQRTVLAMARRIPAGTVWTYAQLAKAINRPRASRAVGHALGSNPLPVVIPCHRIIATSGKLQGYAFGLEIKRRLLMLEGALA